MGRSSRATARPSAATCIRPTSSSRLKSEVPWQRFSALKSVCPCRQRITSISPGCWGGCGVCCCCAPAAMRVMLLMRPAALLVAVVGGLGNAEAEPRRRRRRATRRSCCWRGRQLVVVVVRGYIPQPTAAQMEVCLQWKCSSAARLDYWGNAAADADAARRSTTQANHLSVRVCVRSKVRFSVECRSKFRKPSQIHPYGRARTLSALRMHPCQKKEGCHISTPRKSLQIYFWPAFGSFNDHYFPILSVVVVKRLIKRLGIGSSKKPRQMLQKAFLFALTSLSLLSTTLSARDPQKTGNSLGGPNGFWLGSENPRVDQARRQLLGTLKALWAQPASIWIGRHKVHTTLLGK